MSVVLAAIGGGFFVAFVVFLLLANAEASAMLVEVNLKRPPTDPVPIGSWNYRRHVEREHQLHYPNSPRRRRSQRYAIIAFACGTAAAVLIACSGAFDTYVNWRAR